MHFQNSLHVCVAMQTWYFYKVILIKVRFCSGLVRVFTLKPQPGGRVRVINMSITSFKKKFLIFIHSGRQEKMFVT